MPALNLDLNYFSHIKVVRLVGLLGRGAEVLPIRVWCHCGVHHPESGRLAGYSAQEIESLAGWWGQSGVAIAAMEKVGLLEKIDDVWQVHDWHKTNGHLVSFHVRGKKAAEARWGSHATSMLQALHKSNSSNAPTNPHHTTPTKEKQRARRVSIEEIEIPESLRQSETEIRTWLKYKHERGQKYRPTGLEALWRAIEIIPPEKRKESIEHSMASNYAGIFEKKGGGFNGARKPGNSFRDDDSNASKAGSQSLVVL